MIKEEQMDKIEHLPYTYADKLMEIESEFTYSVIMGAIKKYVPPGASILDIGSGRGELMEKLADAGYEVCGCDIDRSEERRVGKECRSRWSPYQ